MDTKELAGKMIEELKNQVVYLGDKYSGFFDFEIDHAVRTRILGERSYSVDTYEFGHWTPHVELP